MNPKKICYFGTKSFDALSTLWFVTKVIKHMISHWWRNNQTIASSWVSLHWIIMQAHLQCHWLNVKQCDSEKEYEFVGIVV